MQKRTNCAEIWLSWPSQRRSRLCPLALSFVVGSKHLSNQSSPWILLVHPFVLQEKCHVFATSLGIQRVITFSPLNIISGRIISPVAQMHSTAVIHSCRPGSAWYFRHRRESTTTSDVCPVPTLKPTVSAHNIKMSYRFHPYCKYFPMWFDSPQLLHPAL